MTILAILFFITALLYACVGFGGGSTYNALLVLAGADFRILPSVALICNILVVTSGVITFRRAGHLEGRRLAPFLATSLPLAWFGGRIAISETMFIGILGLSLLIAGSHMILSRHNQQNIVQKPTSVPVALVTGAGIGFISGLVGIGGGIFLAPILYIMRWGNPRQIAAACSLFIFVNSLSGLTGQLMKLGEDGMLTLARDYWTVFPAVLIGGQIGARLSIGWLKSSMIKRLTAILILYISIRLLWRWSVIVF